jgi:hypothetical protein
LSLDAITFINAEFYDNNRAVIGMVEFYSSEGRAAPLRWRLFYDKLTFVYFNKTYERRDELR